MRVAWQRLAVFYHAPDEGGAAGAGAAGAAGGDGGNPFGAAAAAGAGAGAAAAAAAAGAGGGPQPYFPEKFPDHLRGASDKETIDKMFGAYSGLRTDMAQRGSVPKDSDGYTIEVSEDLQKVFGDLSKDRGVGIFKTLALKHGLTDKQAAGFFQDYHAEALSAGLVKTVDLAAEAKKLAGNAGNGKTPEALKAEAAQRWETSIDWLDGLVAAKTLTAEQAAIAKSIGETADGVLFLEAMAGMSRERGLGTGGQGGGQQLTKADLDQRNNDPRNQPFSGKFDQKFHDETTELWKQFYAGSGKR
ncbi:MAG: hypothetical protein ACRCS9_13930 [Hyphomicrobium sp.]